MPPSLRYGLGDAAVVPLSTSGDSGMPQATRLPSNNDRDDDKALKGLETR